MWRSVLFEEYWHALRNGVTAKGFDAVHARELAATWRDGGIEWDATDKASDPEHRADAVEQACRGFLLAEAGDIKSMLTPRSARLLGAPATGSVADVRKAI